MSGITYTVKAEVFHSVDELSETDRLLVHSAREAAARAYAPYSKYRVGAAVLLDNGKIITGNNQENAAYPSSLCAERTALFSASSQYPGVAIRSLAVTTNPDRVPLEDYAKPCGGCRQVISEYEDLAKSPIRIILDGATILVMNGIDNLLPFRFTKSSL